MSAKRRDILAVVADTHIGSTVAICPPSVMLDDGGGYRPSRGQQWLWQCWGDYWQTVMAHKPQGGGHRWCVHLGDVGEGNHHGTTQIVTANPVTQSAMVAEVLEPVARWADRLFVIRGTEAHAGPSASSEESAADDLGAVRDDLLGTASWWHLLLEVGGARFDLAHHPPSFPGREQTRGNAAVTLASVVIAEYARTGDKPPQFALRGHAHLFADSGETYQTRGVLCPAWQLATGYANKRRPGQLAHIGGLLFVIEGGAAVMRHIPFAPQRRAAWREGG